MTDTNPTKLQSDGVNYAVDGDAVLISRRFPGDVHSRMVLTADGRLLAGDGVNAPGLGGALGLFAWRSFR